MSTPDRPSPPSFPFGAVHHGDFLKLSPPMTPAEHRDEMRSEITAMVELGFTCYNINLAWGDLEVADGIFDWSRSDVVYDLCREAGLPVYLWLFAEVTPPWFTRAHPEAAAVAATGVSSPSHSYGSTVARDRVRRYIHAVVDRYGDPARVLGYNVGVESGFFWIAGQERGDVPAKLWDYNAEVLADFAPWLEQRYGSLDELNRIWRGHLRSFTEASPPRRRYVGDHFMLVNQVPWLDWRHYMVDVLTSYVHFKADCIRERQPDAVVGSHTFEIDPALHGQDAWRINDMTDTVGTSMFVGPGSHGQLRASYWHDYLRSSAPNKDYCIWELRCDQDAWGINMWGPPVSAADVGRFTWQAIAHDAKSIQYWNWRPHVGGIESGGHGLVDRDGSPNERTQRVGRIAAFLRREGSWLRAARLDKAGIAILDPRLARVLAAGEGSDELVMESQYGAYGLFRTNGHRVDFVHEDRLDHEVLRNLKLVVIPLGYAMRRHTADQLEAWVAAGGHLLAGMWCGAKDESGFGEPHIPGLGLHRVFGADQTGVNVHHGLDDGSRASPLNIKGPPAGAVTLTVTRSLRDHPTGTTFTGYTYTSALRLFDGAEPIVNDPSGACVGSRRQHGHGEAVALGFPPRRSDHFTADALTLLADDFALLAGLRAPAYVVDRGDAEVQVEVLRGSDERHLLVVLNGGDHDLELDVRIPGLTIGAARDAESDEGLPFVGDTVHLTIHSRDGRGILLRSETP